MVTRLSDTVGATSQLVALGDDCKVVFISNENHLVDQNGNIYNGAASQVKEVGSASGAQFSFNGKFYAFVIDTNGDVPRVQISNGVVSSGLTRLKPSAIPCQRPNATTGGASIGGAGGSSTQATSIGGSSSPSGPNFVSTVGGGSSAGTPVQNSGCPCVTTDVPFNAYLSLSPTPNSQTVRGSRRKVVCQQTPDGTPQIPCDELNGALQRLAPATGSESSLPPSNNFTPNQMNDYTTHMNDHTVALSGITREVTDSIINKPVSSALELGAGVGVALWAHKKYKLPLAAIIGLGVLTSFAAGKITDNINI